MSTIWIDGFDHYGTGATGTANMLLGAWSVAPGTGPSTTQARTETHSYLLPKSSLPTLSSGLRRSLEGPKVTVGVAQARYMDVLPDDSTGGLLFGFSDVDNVGQLAINVLADGNIRVYRCAGNFDSSFHTNAVTLGTTTTPPLSASAWHHIECKVTIDNTTGAVEVRVNGVSVLSLTNVDTQRSSLAEVSNVHFSSDANTNSYLDDVVAWDTSGSNNNDFIGDRKVYYRKPDADTAETDWVRNTGIDDFDAINDLVQDGDTTYLESTVVGDISEFTLEDLPATVGAVSCVYVAGMYKKTDAGDGSIRQSMVTGGSPNSVAQGASQAITTAYTYWDDVFETDPSTGALWTPAGFNAAMLRIERTL